MDEFLNSLRIKEKELLEKLEGSPVFRRLESLRNTITQFEGNGDISSKNGHTIETGVQSVAIYDPVNFSWRERILFVIGKLGSAGIAEIISEIQKLEPNVYTKQFLDKRVGVTVSQLKKKGTLGVKVVNKKNKYFIK
jgi:hypothetical protein